MLLLLKNKSWWMASAQTAFWTTFAVCGVRTNSFSPMMPRSSRSASRAFSSSRLYAEQHQKEPGKTPIHLLAGFLGSGKTTVLQHLLENTEGVKIGVLVNDVASVNIDAKLVSKQSGNLVELQNGCACCSLAGEFLDSIETLAPQDFDAVMVELSGVADPVAIQNTWKQAAAEPRSVTERAELKSVITVVDCTTFGTDYLTWDFVKDRKGWAPEGDDCGGNQKIAELLAEQVEAANLIVLNKLDLATEDQIHIASKMVASLNDKATVISTQHGKVSPASILNAYDNEKIKEQKEEESSHSHSHDHNTETCEDPNCTDSSHDHSHEDTSPTGHSHSHDHDAACDDPGCTDTSHSHSHDHEAVACKDPGCTDKSHSHSHDHDAAACQDPDCTDKSHSHSHDHATCDDPGCTEDHSHSHDHATSTESMGITNFVYKATRPFCPRKIQKLLLTWPIITQNVLEDYIAAEDDGDDDSQGKNPFQGVLRSKGFCWLAPSSWDGVLADPWRHDTVFYWSHAGKHMKMEQAGTWWGALPREQMKMFFNDNPKEYQRVIDQDFVTEEFGDRRQELVFIGVGLNQKDIIGALDDCLLTDQDMDEYQEQLRSLEEKIRQQEEAMAAASTSS